MSAAPLISVCIMAYNRAAVLPALLESIVVQDYDDFEIVICEDMSPERPAIGRVVADYTARLPGRIRYFENVKNLGYDANLRNVIERARGKYCLFMNNDDLLCPGAITAVASALKRHENVGVILRSYASFDETPDRIKQEFRYFETERFFPAGDGHDCNHLPQVSRKLRNGTASRTINKIRNGSIRRLPFISAVLGRQHFDHEKCGVSAANTGVVP
jgi:glycosyltransferase involved in cell wall biosynthesis